MKPSDQTTDLNPHFMILVQTDSTYIG